MIYVREEGALIRQGFNFYPRKSFSRGFLLAVGRWRLILRYSKVTGWLSCYSWREDTADAGLEL